MKLDILKWLTPLVLLLATACGYDELVVQPDEPPVEKETPYVELRIAVPLANPASTRANPMGGEEGNGREPGTLKEDLIHDINVFFYIEDDGKGMDSDDAVLIKRFYYNLDNDNDPDNSKLWYGDPMQPVEFEGEDYYKPYYEKGYVVIKLKCTEEDLKKIDQNNGVNFVAVANVGSIQFIEGMKLSELRETQYEYYGNSWNSAYDEGSMNAEKMDYFQMSTAYNGNYPIGGQYTGDNKIKKTDSEYTGTTTLQRVYARLDLWYNHANAITEGTGTNAKVKELKYSIVEYDNDKKMDVVVKGEDGNNDFADVYITNILPVNIMQKPSFLFKKVIELPDDDTWNALTNYTVWNSTSTVWTTGTSKWGGKETPSGIPTSKPNDLPTNYVIERHTAEKNSDGIAGDLTAWYGTTRTEQVKTDIVSTAKGSMNGYYHGTPNSASTPDYGCDRIAILSYANENTHPTDCYHSNYLTGMAFRAVYVPEKIYSSYGDVTDEEGKTTTKLIEATSKPDKIYRYSPTTKDQVEKNSIYFTDRSEAEKYANAHPQDMAIITPKKPSENEDAYFTATEHDGKWGFICYYNLWLRHYNDEGDDPQINYPMEYATVRNNIYRVAVSFRGPGDPTPTMREPDTMKARIFVRKWNYREEDKLVYD